MGGLAAVRPIHASAHQPGFGFVIGRSPSEYLHDVVEPLQLTATQGRWLRTSLPDPSTATPAEIATQHSALLALRARGFSSCILLRFDPARWLTGVRPGAGYHLPPDLREVYARGRAYAAAYGDAVDIWEIDNEPDISFVEENPETFAAYHKAFYFGLRSVPIAIVPLTPFARLRTKLARLLHLHSATPTRVLMAPLALPPGPYLERLLANDFLSYTDGFNYHYYGYAEDFTGVYNQFATLVREHSAQAQGPALRTRDLPVFVTEYGYGLLSGAASVTAEGRERQRRWFADVADQIVDLRIAAPMAFYLSPYLEQSLNEFGLFTRDETTASTPTASPLHTGEHASPALKHLWDYAAQHPYRPRPWPVRITLPSPLVLDFVPGPGLATLKTHRGYQVSALDPAHPELRIGAGLLIVYNFGGTTLGGSLRVTSAEADGDRTCLNQALRLTPGERREIPVTLSVTGARFTLHDITATFVPAQNDLPPAHWVTSLLPAAAGMQRWTVFDFCNQAAVITAERTRLQARPLAREEPRLQPEGRWLVSSGVRVTESADLWRFEVTALPAEPLRPAMAELPLPATFRFSPGELLSFSYRLGLPQLMTAPQRPMLDVYFRTAAGNLYQVWPRQFPRDDWQHYWQHAENFNTGFFGRAEGPWRLSEQRPVALVFFLRPNRLPAVFEIAHPATVTFAQPLAAVAPARDPK